VTPQATETATVPTGNAYPKYDSPHPVERWLVSRFLRRFEAAMSISAPRRVLEVGTGDGVIAERVENRFPAAMVVGIDLEDPAFREQWEQRDMHGAFADAHSLPFADRSFDLVLGIEVLEHLSAPALALAEMARVARGLVVLSVPSEPVWRLGNLARRRYVRDWGNTPGHVQHWGPRRFRRLVSQHLRVLSLWRPLPWTMVLAEAPQLPGGAGRRH
jgi:ubiquinone/menaquinone biosynthesis C-methylase UbiE